MSTYVITRNQVAAIILPTKTLYDETVFEYELKQFKEVGLVGFVKRHKWTIHQLMRYITRTNGLLKPVSYIQIREAT